MADSFQLKAIITAVDKVSAPLKGMQRQLKGFKKEFASLSLGAAGAGTAVLGALALPVKSAIALESKMADVRKVVDGLDTPEAFKAMTEQVRDLSTENCPCRRKVSPKLWRRVVRLVSPVTS